MSKFLHRAVLAIGLFSVAFIASASDSDPIDYSLWEKDFSTLVSHLRMEYVPPTDKPYVIAPGYLAWREKHLKNASPEIKAEALSTLDKLVRSGKHREAQASYIEYLGAMGNLNASEIEKVTDLVVDVTRIDGDWGQDSIRVGVFLQSFLAQQKVPHGEEIAIRAMGSSDVFIRSAAAVALGSVGTEKGLKALRKYLLTHGHDPNSDVSLECVQHFAKELEKRLGAHSTKRE